MCYFLVAPQGATHAQQLHEKTAYKGLLNYFLDNFIINQNYNEDLIIKFPIIIYIKIWLIWSTKSSQLWYNTSIKPKRFYFYNITSTMSSSIIEMHQSNNNLYVICPTSSTRFLFSNFSQILLYAIKQMCQYLSFKEIF